jgi:hypothetical protein
MNRWIGEGELHSPVNRWISVSVYQLGRMKLDQK